MNLLEGKNALVFGLGNKRSIAWGITKSLQKHGANVGVSHAGGIMEKRAVPLAESLGLEFIEPCDVTSDDQIEAVTQKAQGHFGEIDILVHAIAYAGRAALTGPYYGVTREDFKNAMDISVYSFTALARAFQPILRRGGSLLTLTYYGAEKVTASYNVMGVAKAALESSVRYLARDFGSQGVRVNAISAGPVRTLAASGVSGFRYMYTKFLEAAPLKQNITSEDVGNTVVMLASELSSKITGEILYVDSGYNILGYTGTGEEEQNT